MNIRLFNKALSLGRPPNVGKLFPNSKALLVSGKFINSAMIKKGKAIAIATNGRNIFVIRGALKAAQRAKSVLIIEIARSEGGSNAYCSVNYWNIARIVDSLCNELKINIPVAIHADHYTIKKIDDIPKAVIEIPTLFESGITSFALDSSYLSIDHNLLATIKLSKLIPKWSSLETEIGEIKGALDLSTKDEALFMIRGLNAHNIFPDWIAINNGTVHGIESNSGGIQLSLTAKIHKALLKYGVYGAQHGTSGNNTSTLQQLRLKTKTTKANIATALQMISWGVKVNIYGNAESDKEGNLIKLKGHGMNQDLWNEMIQYAATKKWTKIDYKRLNLVFENKLLGQPKKIKERMVKNVEDFVYDLLVNVFNAGDTAELALESIIETGSYHNKTNSKRIENIIHWSPEKILKRAHEITENNKSKISQENFDD